MTVIDNWIRKIIKNECFKTLRNLHLNVLYQWYKLIYGKFQIWLEIITNKLIFLLFFRCLTCFGDWSAMTSGFYGNVRSTCRWRTTMCWSPCHSSGPRTHHPGRRRRRIKARNPCCQASGPLHFLTQKNHRMR